MLTRVNAVEAVDTTRAVNSRDKAPLLLVTIGNENSRTLAGSFTQTARFALVCLDIYANNTLGRKNTKQSADRTKTIAIETTINPRYDENDDECHCGDNEDWHRAHPHIDLIIVEVARSLTTVGQEIVAHLVQRLQQHRDNATE